MSSSGSEKSTSPPLPLGRQSQRLKNQGYYNEDGRLFTYGHLQNQNRTRSVSRDRRRLINVSVTPYSECRQRSFTTCSISPMRDENQNIISSPLQKPGIDYSPENQRALKNGIRRPLHSVSKYRDKLNEVQFPPEPHTSDTNSSSDYSGFSSSFSSVSSEQNNIVASCKFKILKNYCVDIKKKIKSSVKIFKKFIIQVSKFIFNLTKRALPFLLAVMLTLLIISIIPYLFTLLQYCFTYGFSLLTAIYSSASRLLIAQLSGFYQPNASLLDRIAELEQILHSQTSSRDENAFTKEINQLYAKVQTLEKSKSKSDLKNNFLRSQIGDLRAKIDNLSSNTAVRDEIDSLGQKLTATNSQMHNLDQSKALALLTRQIEDLKSQVSTFHAKSLELDNHLLLQKNDFSSNHDNLFRGLNTDIEKIQKQLDMLEDSKNSQDRKLNDISNHFKESEGSLKNLILKKFATSSNKFNGDGVEKLAEEIKKIEHHLLELKSKTEEKYQFFETQLEEKLAASNLPENYHETVLSQLRKYDADKTAQIDWAYFNSGGQVVKASPPYTGRPGLVSFLGLPLFYKYKKPDLVIQPDVNPGSCFAFAGSKGFILLKFATDMKIIPTAITIEHVNPSLVGNRILSAPRLFSVVLLEGDRNSKGVLLNGPRSKKGYFEFDPLRIEQNSYAGTLDYYTLSNTLKTRFVEIQIHSNWGEESHTCVYRVRVHGALA